MPLFSCGHLKYDDLQHMNLLFSLLVTLSLFFTWPCWTSSCRLVLVPHRRGARFIADRPSQALPAFHWASMQRGTGEKALGTWSVITEFCRRHWHFRETTVAVEPEWAFMSVSPCCSGRLIPGWWNMTFLSNISAIYPPFSQPWLHERVQRCKTWGSTLTGLSCLGLCTFVMSVHILHATAAMICFFSYYYYYDWYH